MAARPVVSVYGANGAATGETINMPAVFKEMISNFYHSKPVFEPTSGIGISYLSHFDSKTGFDDTILK